MIGIYLIINTVNGKLYIGSSVNVANRFADHISLLNNQKHKNKHLQSAWNFYGADVFHFCVVEECLINDLLIVEQKWIDANFENCYNLSPTAGNTLGKLHSKETKFKIAKSKIGFKHTEEAKAKMKGRQNTFDNLKKINALGLALTPEARANHSKSLEGNQRRRDLGKWPHDLGVKCKCRECKNKRNLYVKNWNANKKVLGVEF